MRSKLESKQISNLAELVELENNIFRSADLASDAVASLCSNKEGMAAFRQLRFENVGRDPMNSNRPLNFIEQLNQTFSSLVALKAARYVLEHHPTAVPLTVTFGPIKGFDLVSKDRSVVAEVFAAVTANSNDKLKQDTQKVAASHAKHKYVFYYAARGRKPTDEVSGVKRIYVSL